MHWEPAQAPPVSSTPPIPLSTPPPRGKRHNEEKWTEPAQTQLRDVWQPPGPQGKWQPKGQWEAHTQHRPATPSLAPPPTELIATTDPEERGDLTLSDLAHPPKVLGTNLPYAPQQQNTPFTTVATFHLKPQRQRN